MPDCSIFTNFTAERARMCERYTYPSGKHECEKCALFPLVTKDMKMRKKNCRSCIQACFSFPDEAIPIVQKWSDENAIVTRQMWFLKQFPNASLEQDGHPTACAGDVFGFSCAGKGENACRKCWSERYKEGEGKSVTHA